ncbi:MAG: hypothetical protein CML14_06955 [Puniceicoccaceae bacterium]|nr:hypothetical protein [Puniceicoccaceae bacterium]
MKRSKLPILLSNLILFSFNQGISREGKSTESILLPGIMYDAAGKIKADDTKGKIIGLYFSASWCSSCRRFNPRLVTFRNQNLEKFEVVLISGDGSETAQQNYMKKFKMPWPALGNRSEDAKNLEDSVKKILDVEFISLPSLIILDPAGKVISANGKDEILTLGDNALTSWKNATKGE